MATLQLIYDDFLAQILYDFMLGSFRPEALDSVYLLSGMQKLQLTCDISAHSICQVVLNLVDLFSTPLDLSGKSRRSIRP